MPQAGEKIRISEVRIHQIGGKAPDGSDMRAFAKTIEPFEGVDVEALTEGDDDPMFVTLDFLVDDVTSENGLVYSPEFNQSVSTQMPGKGAKYGHTKWTDAGSPADCADWIGIKKVGATSYAKAYIPRGEIREDMRRKKARGGQVRTSIEGEGIVVPILTSDGRDTGTYTLKDFVLESLDFVRANHAALRQHQSGNPAYTSETIQEKPPMPEEIAPVTPTPPAPPVVPQPPVDESKAMSEMKKQVRAMTQQLQENAEKMADYAAIVEKLGSQDDPILALDNVLADRNSLRIENAALLKEAIALQVAAKVKLEAARSLIANMVESMKPVRKVEVGLALDKVLQRPEVMEMLRIETLREMGPNHTRPAVETTQTPADPVLYIP